jgi:hypothetical protein
MSGGIRTDWNAHAEKTELKEDVMRVRVWNTGVQIVIFCLTDELLAWKLICVCLGSFMAGTQLACIRSRFKAQRVIRGKRAKKR